MKYFIFSFVVIFCAIGCKKNSNGPAGNSTPGDSTVPANVYIAGVENNSAGNASIKFWNNGTTKILSDSSTPNIYCSGLFVSGTDVYVGGYEYIDAGSTTNGIVRYWKNGIVTNLSDGTDYAASGGLFVSGSDVYVAGLEYSIDQTKIYAKYWKNGQSVNLTNGTYYADAIDVVVSGTDVYLAGTQNIGGEDIVTSWKNGVATNFPDEGSTQSQPFSMAASGSDIYEAGEIGGLTAAYWKNGVAVKLTDGSQYARAFGIYISGSDVYVAGFDAGAAVYWKNGKEVVLTDSTLNSQANSIYASGTDVYVVGNYGNTAEFWKNGKAIALTDGKYLASANHIVVK